MHIGSLVIEIMVYSSASLKEKRYVLKGLKDRLKHKFNIAVAEIDYQDKWQRSKIGIVTISNDYGHVQNSLQQVFSFLDQSDEYEIISYEFKYY
jgi:uncharacterized protein YlxP (DUF503 family)